MIRAFAIPCVLLYLLLFGNTPADAQTPDAAEAMSTESQLAMIDQYCFDCHNFEKSSGDMVLEMFNPALAHQEPELAEKIIRKLNAGMMPPAGKPRPDRTTVRSFINALANVIDASARPRPGRPGPHRLNRVEYTNAIRDLLALEVDATQFLPPDDSSRGFDNQAGTLGLSPALLEAYLSAAGKISRMAVGNVTAPTQTLYRVAADMTQNYHVEGLSFGTRGGLLIKYEFPADGDYNIKVFSVNLGNMGNFSPFGEVRGEQLEISLDGKRVQLFDWDKELEVGMPYDERSGQLQTIDARIPVSAGPHSVGVTFLATNYAPGLDLNKPFDRSTIETGGLPGFTFYPHIGSVRIDGPYQARGASDTPSRGRIFVCYPETPAMEQACARKIIAKLARRAYRGNASVDDIDELMDFYSNGGDKASFDARIEMMLQRILADPKFIYRIEYEPEGLAENVVYPVSDQDLAARLSFFLWSSIPDDALLDLAERQQLHQPELLEDQVQRMLDDPRSTALAENFAGQWLALRNLDGHAPVVDQFPDFDDNLRQALRRETELFFDSIIRENRSVLDLLTADYTFVNERLARHYGIPGVKGSRFRRITLGDEFDARRGLLGKGSILTVSSQPGRTSPVIRGNWVLSNIIGVPAPDPPPDVPELKPQQRDAAGNVKTQSMREQMEQHRSDPACKGCHQLMDPIGFSLESFDAIGKWRTQDGGNPIDGSAVLYDGTPTQGPAELRGFLLQYSDQFVSNLTVQLLIYALGRGIEYNDMPAVRAIVREAQRDNYRFRSLLKAIIKSDTFRMNSKTAVGTATIADVNRGRSPDVHNQ